MDQEPFPETTIGHGLNPATGSPARADTSLCVPSAHAACSFSRSYRKRIGRRWPCGAKRGDERGSGGAWNVNFNNGNVNWNNLNNDNYVRAVRP